MRKQAIYNAIALPDLFLTATFPGVCDSIRSLFKENPAGEDFACRVYYIARPACQITPVGAFAEP